MERTDIRLALPSKGILQQGALSFLEACGLKVFRPNPRQYAATLPALPGVTVMFQRPGDIVVSVQQGSIDFGITGYDVLAERQAADDGIGITGEKDSALILHDALGFGPCTLNLAAPDFLAVDTIADMAEMARVAARDGRVVRIATKFPNLTRRFLDRNEIEAYELIGVEGTLEIAPAIGYADLIADLVSSGVTLRDNHLHQLEDGEILRSEAVLIANRQALIDRPEVLATARRLLEYIEAHQRAEGSFLVTANMRGESAESVAQLMFERTTLGGLQGPTISPVITRDHWQVGGTNWFAVNIVVQQKQLFDAINELRAIGGSGVIVAPCTYIFEEEPARYRAMLNLLAE